MLLGVTMDEEGNHFIGTALPLDEVDSSDVELVGRLAELVDRLGRALIGCRRGSRDAGLAGAGEADHRLS